MKSNTDDKNSVPDKIIQIVMSLEYYFVSFLIPRSEHVMDGLWIPKYCESPGTVQRLGKQLLKALKLFHVFGLFPVFLWLYSYSFVQVYKHIFNN